MSGLSEEPTWSFPTSPRYWFSDSTPLVFRNDWPDGSEANFLAHDKMMYDATQIWSRLMKYDYNHSLDQGSLSLMPSRASRAFNVWLPAHEAIISDMGFSPFDDSRLNDGDMDSSLGIIPNIPSLPLTIGPMSEINLQSFNRSSTEPFSKDGTTQNTYVGSGEQCNLRLSASPVPSPQIATPAVHNLLQANPSNSCQQCHTPFPTQTALSRHAKQTQHSSYLCTCGKAFSRLDVVNRHIQGFHSTSKYPCPLCKKYRGNKAFHRLDHLTQHLKSVHQARSDESLPNSDENEERQIRSRKRGGEGNRVSCLHRECSSSKGSPRSQLQTKAELTRHMREVHDESLFPCPESGCLRVRGKGFFRRKDLLKHHTEHHSQGGTN